MSGINQVMVKDDIGMTFAAALRSMLRQAPNIIMIGEIRDLETANIAINASLTGHLGFQHPAHQRRPLRRGASGRHRHEAVPHRLRRARHHGPAPRPPALCRLQEPAELSEEELRALNLDASQLTGATVMRPIGCEKCRGNGYNGRLGIFEIFDVDDEVRHMINKQLPPSSCGNAPANSACAPCAKTASARCSPA